MTGEERDRRDSRALEVDNRTPYFDALDAADLACRGGKIDVSKMEELLGSLLANQLAQFYKSVGGKLPG